MSVLHERVPVASTEWTRHGGLEAQTRGYDHLYRSNF